MLTRLLMDLHIIIRVNLDILINLYRNETVSIVIPRLSIKDSGLYTLSCKSLEETNFSKTVDLYVAGK